ncbi:hypothetical protein LTS18_010980 [Coniosporium uncinatum]|uniref:Uncharacterized protein n=1 Tax=Coniosporium uncinatum TaxID=93489 RepID=A0ACC3DW47_9PEZI|nr:hypothetical protein LTS18_010980 [Coniosporium uncinatum]
MSAISSRGPDGPDKLKDLSEPQCIIYDEEKEFSHAVKIWNLLSEASALLRHTELEVAYNTTTGKWGIIKRGLTGYREDASPSEAGAVIAEVEHQRGVNALTARPEQVGREASLPELGTQPTTDQDEVVGNEEKEGTTTDDLAVAKSFPETSLLMPQPPLSDFKFPIATFSCLYDRPKSHVSTPRLPLMKPKATPIEPVRPRAGGQASEMAGKHPMNLTPLYLKAASIGTVGTLKGDEPNSSTQNHKRKASDPLYQHPRAATRPRKGKTSFRP